MRSTFKISCKHSIPLAMWDVKGNCAKGRSKEALQINRDLDNIKAQIIKLYQHRSDRAAFVAAEMVRNSYQGFGSEYETLLNAFDKDIASLKKRVGKDRVASTLWAMQRSRKDVADFLQSNLRWTDISMLELTPEFIKDFAAYLSIGRGLANGTVWQRCMWLKGVVLRAHYNGKIPRNPFAQFHISPNCKERAYLAEDELKIVMTHEFEDADLAFVRDIFIFVCFTALSFIDVKELTTGNIVEVNGDKWIIGRRHKTNIPFQVKLMDVPLQIIYRYKHLQEEKLVFGKMNYWSMCEKLKRVMKACGIEKQISYHQAHHTFATILSKLNANEEKEQQRTINSQARQIQTEQPKENTRSERHKHNEPSIGIPSLGLFDTTNPVYDPAEEEFRRRMQKKKKRRGPKL